jgi:hypothetical protein
LDTTTAVEEIRARLGELVPDFWTAPEVLRALNAACVRFGMAEKWEWLYTVGSDTLTAGTADLTLTPGVSVNRHFLLSGLFSGDNSPRTPTRVTASEGFMLQRTHYTDASDPVAFYLASVEDTGSNEIETVTNAGSTSGTFTLTYSGQTTAVISRGATAAEIQAALRALSNIGDADVRCYGGPLGTAAVYIEFRGALGGLDITPVTLGGTTTSMTVATTQAGGAASGLYAATLRFVPALTRDMQLEYIYLRTPRTLISGTDVIDIPEEYVDAVIAHATARLWLKELRDSAKADEQFGLYYAVLDDAKRDQRKLIGDENFAWGKNQPQTGMQTEADYAYGHFSGHLG